MALSRRAFFAAAVLPAALAAPRLARAQAGAGRVVIIGGGFGGASAARFARDNFPALDVTLIERSRTFTTCPYGNLVLAGRRDMNSITFGYEKLAARGVRVVHQSVVTVDAAAKQVRLADGAQVPYDRLIMSPGIDLRWGAIEGYDEAASERMPHGWVPSLQPISLLRRQLEAMPDGGRFVMVIPDNPFRCPPGPYERISMVADYLKRAKPRSKLIALDAKNGFSKQPLFQDAWEELYPGIIEWRGASNDGRVTRVNAAAMEVETEFGEKLKGDVVNVIPRKWRRRSRAMRGLPINPAGARSSPLPWKARRWKAFMCWAMRPSRHPCRNRALSHLPMPSMRWLASPHHSRAARRHQRPSSIPATAMLGLITEFPLSASSAPARLALLRLKALAVSAHAMRR